MSTTVLVVEGVLAGRDDDADLAREAPDDLAQHLYSSMSRVGRLVLASRVDRRLVEHWCRVHGFTAHGGVTALSSRTVTALRAQGEDVALYVDHDGERAAAVLKSGVPTMLFAKPLYARAAHRPSGMPQLARPFAAVLAEARLQRADRALPVLEDD